MKRTLTLTLSTVKNVYVAKKLDLHTHTEMVGNKNILARALRYNFTVPAYVKNIIIYCCEYNEEKNIYKRRCGSAISLRAVHNMQIL